MSCSFKDAIVDTIIAKTITQGNTTAGLQGILRPATGKTAKIRKLIVAIAVFKWIDHMFDALTPSEPDEIANATITNMGRRALATRTCSVSRSKQSRVIALQLNASDASQLWKPLGGACGGKCWS